MNVEGDHAQTAAVGAPRQRRDFGQRDGQPGKQELREATPGNLSGIHQSEKTRMDQYRRHLTAMHA